MITYAQVHTLCHFSTHTINFPFFFFFFLLVLFAYFKFYTY